MPDNPRIEELRGRVQKDPSSIAFAQLAEEYRRAGRFEEAIKTCRTGLTRHPGYLSARVTLGRALIETDELDAAETELSLVVKSSPENLAAIRGLADVHHRRGNLASALTFYRRALSLARHDPDLEQTVGDIERTLGSPSGPAEAPGGLSFAQVQEELMSFEAATMPTRSPQAPAAPPPGHPSASATLRASLAQTSHPASPGAPATDFKTEKLRLKPDTTTRGFETNSSVDAALATPPKPPRVGTAPGTPLDLSPEMRSVPALEAFLHAITAYRQRSGLSS